MALIKCGSCGNEVSSDAASCPKCGKPVKKSMGIVKILLIAMGGLFALCIVGGIVGGKKDRSAASPAPAVIAPVAAVVPASAVAAPPAQPAESPKVVAAPPPAPPPSEYDSIGTQKEWAALSATLKEVSASGKTGRVSPLLKNDGDEEERISSMLFFNATNQEGDIGKLDLFGGVSCDGAVPPKGVLKCKLAFKFDTAPKEMTVKVGAGILSESTYFKVKVGK